MSGLRIVCQALGDGMRAGLQIIIGREQPAECRLNSEYLKDIARDELRVERFGLLAGVEEVVLPVGRADQHHICPVF